MNFFEMVRKEADRGKELHGPVHSFHEGLGVLWEEFEEVKNEIFKKKPDRDNLLKELIQVSAVCLKMAEDMRLV